MSLRIIDVSEAQGVINWPAVKASGLVDAVVLKATEGQGYVDHQFAANWRESTKWYDIVWAYHFAQPDPDKDDAVIEALHFCRTVLQAVGGAVPAGFVPVLDIEKTGTLRRGVAFVDWVLAWCETVRLKLGVKPVIYTGGPIWDASAGPVDAVSLSALLDYPLWLAAYVKDPSLYVPQVWRDKGWTLWQRSGDIAAPGEQLFRVPGIGGGRVNVDLDVFMGVMDDLRQLCADLRDVRPGNILETEKPTEIPSVQEVLDSIADTDPAPKPESNT